jgi:DNA processing protein
MIDPVLRAVAYLSRVVEPPCPPLAELVARVGPVEVADRVKRREVGDSLLRLTEARYEIDSAARDLAVLERLGGRLVTAADAEWPLLAFTAFAGVDTKQRPQAHPPLALWVTGPARLDEVAERAAAIVGTRAATAYGEHVAAEFAAGLAERDVAVVSGGAYGVDGAAHRAALAADGLTVAVLAGGIDVSYPSGHAALFHRIGEQGLIVTEYPPGLRPQTPVPHPRG